MKLTTKALLLLPLFAAFASGCATLSNRPAYLDGELYVTYEHGFNPVRQASATALEDLGYSFISDEGDRTGTDILARRDDGRVVITLRPAGDTTTDVRIRAGTFGDEDISREVHQAVKRHL